MKRLWVVSVLLLAIIASGSFALIHLQGVTKQMEASLEEMAAEVDRVTGGPGRADPMEQDEGGLGNDDAGKSKNAGQSSQDGQSSQGGQSRQDGQSGTDGGSQSGGGQKGPGGKQTTPQEESRLAQMAADFQKQWEKDEAILIRYIHHDELDTITGTVARLQALAKYDSIPELAAEIDRLRHLVRHIYESQIPFPRNIF